MQKIVHFSPMQQTPSFIDITPILLSTEQTIAHFHLSINIFILSTDAISQLIYIRIVFQNAIRIYDTRDNIYHNSKENSYYKDTQRRLET